MMHKTQPGCTEDHSESAEQKRYIFAASKALQKRNCPEMSRRKVKGLTRTGRQVSEDPDLDSLLSTLSPEEVEALDKDLGSVPDIAPEDGKIIVLGESHPAPEVALSKNSQETSRPSVAKGKLSPQEPSSEGESRKESRKQEYLRKMGLGQDDNMKVGVGRRSIITRDRDTRKEDGDNKVSESMKEAQSWRLSRHMKQEDGEIDAKEEANERQAFEERWQRRENRESTGSKTKEMISKLQERRDESKEEKKEDCRRRDDTKTKDIISKLREKSEKELGKDKERKTENIRTQGLVSRMVEKQSKTPESQSQESRRGEEKLGPEVTEEQPKSENAGGRSQREDLANHSEHVKDSSTMVSAESESGQTKENGNRKGSHLTTKENETPGNHVAKNCPNSKMKQDEDEESSMFDDLMRQVQTNDPSLTELNVNNSEVIKAKTLIEFATALCENTCVKSFALANCRADDHVAYAIAGMLRCNKTITSINLDSNHLTGKGILSLIQSLQHNSVLTELRFQNQRHICGGKTEMEMVKILKENTTLLKLGYHFELACPRMTTTNILSRNMDRQRQRRLQEQKQAQANGDKKGALEVPKAAGGGSLRSSPKSSPKPSPIPSPMPSPKLRPRKEAGGPTPPPPPPPPGGGPPPPPPPLLDGDRSFSSKNSRDQLLASIRGSNVKQLKKVPIPKWLQ